MTPPISPDGRSFWDGARWRSLVSADGRMLWNGAGWIPLEPSPIGASGPVAASMPPPVASSAVMEAPAAPVAGRPDWLASEGPLPASLRHVGPAPAAGPVPASQPVYVMRQPQAVPPISQSLKALLPPERLVGLALIVVIVLGGAGWWVYNSQASQLFPDVLVASQAKLTYPPGGVLRFAVHQSLDGRTTLSDGSSVTDFSATDSVEDWRVVSVAPDGTATIGFKFESLSGTINGQNVVFNVANAKEVTITISNDGRVVAGGTNGTAGGKANQSVPGSDQFFSILPHHDVKAGESWGDQWTRPNPLGTGTTTYSTNSTFVRYDFLASGRAAVVHTVASLPIDVALNIRALMALTGEDPGNIPAGATIQYKGQSNDDTTTYVDMGSRLPAHILQVSNFTFDLTFQGLPGTPEFAPLAGKFHFGGHQNGDMTLLNVPTGVPSPAASPHSASA